MDWNWAHTVVIVVFGIFASFATQTRSQGVCLTVIMVLLFDIAWNSYGKL